MHVLRPGETGIVRIARMSFPPLGLMWGHWPPAQQKNRGKNVDQSLAPICVRPKFGWKSEQT
eukprot:1147419-Pelagomonas_calceolata.AAC.1